MQKAIRGLCPPEHIQVLAQSINADQQLGLRSLDDALRIYPDDPQLHFLKGSILAGLQDFSAARSEMRRAVDLAPGYALARFQLGFLLLTSGEPYAAQEAWGPLYALPSSSFLHDFVMGLSHLIRDEFDEAIRALREGIAKNRENLPLNRDIEMIISAIQDKRSGRNSETPRTAVDLLLQQAALKASKH